MSDGSHHRRASRATVGWMTRLATVALVLAAVAGVALLNLVLLDRASSRNDPVGRLSPAAHLTTTAPPGVVRPATGPIEGVEQDD
jgi:hypothetical protein